MSILVNTGFKVGSAEPLNELSIRETVADRDALVTDGFTYAGMKVYCKETMTEYIWNGIEWKIAGASIDDTRATITSTYSSSKIGELMSQGVIPSGAVIPFAGKTAPQGYLLCDGRAVSRALYPYLFETIGTTYGAGDRSTTFNLPNLQNKFIEGAGNNAVGTSLGAGLPNITGSFYVYTSNTSTGNGAFRKSITEPSISSATGVGNQTPYSLIDFNASRLSSVYGNSNTVQPPAVVMNYIIKY